MTLPVTAARRRPRHTSTGIQLPRTDGRTLASRRFRQLVESFEADLGGQLSTADVALVRQAASLTLASEQIQEDVAGGAQVDPDALVRVSSEARRILGMLRAKAMKNKPSGPTLDDFLAELGAENEADA